LPSDPRCTRGTLVAHSSIRHRTPAIAPGRTSSYGRWTGVLYPALPDSTHAGQTLRCHLFWFFCFHPQIQLPCTQKK
jgi:hypothetical protein